MRIRADVDVMLDPMQFARVLADLDMPRLSEPGGRKGMTVRQFLEGLHRPSINRPPNPPTITTTTSASNGTRGSTTSTPNTSTAAVVASDGPSHTATTPNFVPPSTSNRNTHNTIEIVVRSSSGNHNEHDTRFKVIRLQVREKPLVWEDEDDIVPS